MTIESLDQGFFLTQTQQLVTGPNLVILDLMKMTCYFPNGTSTTWGIYRDYFSFFWVRKTYDSAAEPNQRCTRYRSQDLFRTMPCSLFDSFPRVDSANDWNPRVNPDSSDPWGLPYLAVVAVGAKSRMQFYQFEGLIQFATKWGLIPCSCAWRFDAWRTPGCITDTLGGHGWMFFPAQG